MKHYEAGHQNWLSARNLNSDAVEEVIAWADEDTYRGLCRSFGFYPKTKKGCKALIGEIRNSIVDTGKVHRFYVSMIICDFYEDLIESQVEVFKVDESASEETVAALQEVGKLFPDLMPLLTFPVCNGNTNDYAMMDYIEVVREYNKAIDNEVDDHFESIQYLMHRM